MTVTDHPSIRTELFRELYDGSVVTPGDESYLRDRSAWNLAADLRPAAIVEPADSAGVVAVVRAAAASGLRVAPQGTGHNAAPTESLHDAVLLRTHHLDDIEIDPTGRRAVVGAGALWEDVVKAAAKHGLTALHGSSPNVGVVGYLLGGGISWYSRALGLASNTLLGVDIVLADGQHVRADADRHVEVFWAVRGGGGSFGVVTAVEIELVSIGSVYAGMLLWDQEAAPGVLRAWRDWAATAPTTITSALRLMNFPPLPEIPEFLRGRRVVIIDGAALADDEAGAEILGPLRALGPEIDTFAVVEPESLLHLHMDPEGPLPVVSDSAVLSHLSDEAMTDLLEIAGPDAPPQLLAVELRHLGGALAYPQPGSGAVGHLMGEFLLFAGTVAPTPVAALDGHEAAAAVVEVVSRHGKRPAYLNFVENAIDVRWAFDPVTWRQLVGIKSALDPTSMFVANHPIPTLFENGMPTT
jgi:FAD binding domain